MTTLVIILIIALISILWAYWSFRQNTKHERLNEVKRDLNKGRVVFYSQSSNKKESIN